MRKKRSIKYLLLMVLSLFMFAFGIVTWDYTSPTTASAATTNYYTMPFDYSGSFYAYGMNQASSVSDTNVTSYTFGNYTTRVIAIKLYGTSHTTAATATKGQYFNFNTINIVADVATSTGGTYSLITACRLTSNTTGALVVHNTALANKTLSTALYSGTLADGSYTLSVTWSAKDYMASYPNQTQRTIDMTLTTSFKIDTKAPTLSGTASTTTGKYTNEAFTVSATDTGSGLKAIYMKAPNSSMFTNVGTSKTISKGSENGVYTFYAVDNQSNTSSYGYVYFDDTAPVGTIKNESGAIITSSAVNYGFSYSATDNSSGIYYLQYLSPTSYVWTTYQSGTVFKNTSKNELYQFRAVDLCGNMSEISSVILDTEAGTGTLYADGSIVTSGSIVKANSIKFVASDSLSGVGTIYVERNGSKSVYTNGSELASDGEYSFYFYDQAQNLSATYKITRDTTAPTLTCDDVDWGSTIKNGFTVRANDSYSKAYICYKTPGSSNFIETDSNVVTIPITLENGIYYFYAKDSLGNISATKQITLSVDPPEYFVTKDTPNNRVRISWNITNFSATLNGNNYAKNSWIATEGSYKFVLKDLTTKRSVIYQFTISHYYVEQSVTNPTCEEKGYTTYICVSCSDVYKDDYVPALGHVDYVKQIVDPTCTEYGYTIYDCTVCENHEYTGSFVIPNGHSNYEKEVVEPTCTKDGYYIYDCKICGNNEYIADIIQALGHDYVVEITAPTCTLQGYSTYDCSRCDSRYTADFVAPHGHFYEEELIEPNCTEKGYTLHTCSICFDEYITDYVLALGHDYTEITLQATCTEEGGIKHICVVCDYCYMTEKQNALGHSYSSIVTKESNCLTVGLRTHTCEYCGNQYTTEIPCVEHQFIITDTEENGIVIRHFDCGECGFSYTEDKGNQYEIVTSYVEYLYDEYSPYMIWVFLSTAGVWSAVMGIAFIIAYRNEDRIKANKMLKNYLIGLIVIFGILVAMPYLVNGIAYLVTH